MRRPGIDEIDYIDLQRFNDEKKRLNKTYRYRHRKTYYDHTEWPESTGLLCDIIHLQREGWVEQVELLEEI